MDNYNIYGDLVSQRLTEQNDDINKAQMEMMEKANSIQSRGEKALEEISSAVLLKESLGTAIKYGASKLGSTASKVVSDAVDDYSEGGIPKVVQGLTTKAVNAGTKAVSKASQEVVGDDADDVIQMEPLGELETPIEGSANPTFVGEDADVVDELSGFGDEAVSGAAVQAPTDEAIQAAADVEDGLIPEEEASVVSASQALPEFTGAPIMQTLQGDESIPEAEIADAGEQVADDSSDAIIASTSALVENTADDAASAVSAAASTAADAAADATATAASAAADAAASAGSAVAGAGADAAAAGLEVAGAVADSTGIGAVVGVGLAIGGVLASIFATPDDTPTLPPIPNFSYTIGA
jgi:hypothetical protein